MKKAAITLLLAGLTLAGCGSSSSSSSSATTSNAAATAAPATKVSCPHSPVRFAIEPYDTGPALDTSSYGRKESEGKDFNEDTNFGKLKRIPHPGLQTFLRKYR